MLSASKDGGGNTAEYYAADNYYAAGDNPADSQWLGKGADQLNLTGRIDADAFNAGREGRLPDGSTASTGKARTPGWDFTFSAPKSISVAALVGRDQRLIDAHRGASKAAMAYLERFAATRIREGKEVRSERTGNLVIGRFTHDTSRAGDPALHDHMYVMNRTWHAPSQSWRAVDSRSIYRAKEAASRLYNHELRAQVRDLGYSVTAPNTHGSFEIKGVSAELTEMFSKRRASIVEALKDTVQTATRAVRERVALLTRGAKDFSLKGSERTEAWRTEAGPHLAALDKTVSRSGGLVAQVQGRVSNLAAALTFRSSPEVTDAMQAPSKTSELASSKTADARAAVHMALRDITQMSAVFNEADILSSALQSPKAGQTRAANILGEIDRLWGARQLVRADAFDPSNVTTQSALELEARIVARVTSTASTWRGSAGLPAAQIAMARGLTKDQKDLFHAALDGTERYKAIEGVAGAGKSYTLQSVAQVLAGASEPLALEVLAPLNQQVADLKEAGLDARTATSFVNANSKLLDKDAVRPDRSNRVLAIDEAGQIPNEEMDKLTAIADAAGYGRVILLGDPKQHGAIEAGAPLPLVLRAARRDVHMTDIARQKSPVYKTSARLASQGYVGKALEVLGPSLREAGKDATIERAVFEAWRALPSAKRPEALVVLTNNARRAATTDLIRDALVNDPKIPLEERLGDKTFVTEKLAQVHNTDARINTGMGIDRGDTVIFSRNLRGIGVKKDDTAMVLSIDPERKTAQLKRADGEAVTYKFPGLAHRKAHFRAYKQSSLEIREKERLRWTKTDRERGFFAGTNVKVVSIEDNHIVVETGKDQRVRLAKSDPMLRHVDYAYASTSYAAQGRTNATVIGGVGHQDRNSGNHQSLYVLLSRVGAKGDDPAERLQIVTNDKDKLIARLKGEWSKPDSATLHAVRSNFEKPTQNTVFAETRSSDKSGDRHEANLDREEGVSRTVREENSPSRENVRPPDRSR